LADEQAAAVNPWPPDDPRLTRIWLRKDLIARGYDDRSIRNLVATGNLHRIRYGTYVDAAAWAGCEATGQHSILTRAVVSRARSEVVASHLSAAVEWNVPLWGMPLDIVHVTRRDARAGRREVGVLQHRGRLPDEHVTLRNGLPVTDPTRTAMDCAGHMDLERSMALIGHFLHQEATTRERLHEMADFMERWPGSLRQRIAIDLADGRCESPGEHRTLFLCWDQQLPRPTPQFEVHDGFGNLVARLDFAWPEHRVWLEFDGRVKYQELLRAGEDPTDVVLREKAREQTIARLTGWSCIRIVWADLHRPERTAALIREELARHPGSALSA
jgi:hypothetical protein